MSDIMDHVLRGVALLDEKGPAGWRSKINLDELDQNDVTRCVLGQIYTGRSRNGYDFGKKALGDLSISESGHHGFTASHTAYSGAQFTAAWTRYLASMPSFEQPRIELTREDVKLLAKRFRQIDNPDHSLWETTIEIGGVLINLK